jgi:hypothetical protein
MKTHHGKEEWEAIMEMAKEDARRVPLPPDLFEVWKLLTNFLVLETKDLILHVAKPIIGRDLCYNSLTRILETYVCKIQFKNILPVFQSPTCLLCNKFACQNSVIVSCFPYLN